MALYHERQFTLNESKALPPNVLYAHYKLLSEGIFDAYVDTYTKEDLKKMQERNYECAMKRTLFMENYVDPVLRDRGHLKIIRVALKKAFACHVASMPVYLLKQWYGTQRIVFNTIIHDYQTTQELRTLDYYYNLTMFALYNRQLSLPHELHMSSIEYAMRIICANQGKSLWFLTKKEACRETFWALCGFLDDPLVSGLFTSLWDE